MSKAKYLAVFPDAEVLRGGAWASHKKSVQSTQSVQGFHIVNGSLRPNDFNDMVAITNQIFGITAGSCHPELSDSTIEMAYRVNEWYDALYDDNCKQKQWDEISQKFLEDFKERAIHIF